MKISSYPTYEEWKHDIVGDYKFKSYKVLILPMRNGNQEIWKLNLQIKNSSYPTYEEWKLRYKRMIKLI